MANSALPIGIFNSNLINVQVFKTSGTYTPSTGVTRVLVKAWGAGGGGGTTNAGNPGSSGGGGAYVEAMFANTVSQTITIGASGAGGLANNASNGGTGGDTSFGSILVAKGGGGGQSGGGAGGVGGTIAGSTVPSGGLAMPGGAGYTYLAGGLSALSIGGGTAWGSQFNLFSTNSASTNPGLDNTGQGGSGGTSSLAGAAGGTGLLIVFEYSSATPTTGSSAAIQSEMEAASATNVFVSPGMQKYHPGSAKAWVRYYTSGGAVTNVASYNVSGLTYNGPGDVTVNFLTAFSSATAYSWSGSGVYDNGTSSPIIVAQFPSNSGGADPTASSCRLLSIISTLSGSAGNTDLGSGFCVSFFGDQ